MKKYLLIIEDEELWGKFKEVIDKDINTEIFELIKEKVKKGGNIDTLREILKSLGFNKEIIFEKKRKNVFKNDITISFDKLPFGFFVEFEGGPETINKYLDKFNLSGRPRITRAYLGLWEDYRKAHSITEENCMFK